MSDLTVQATCGDCGFARRVLTGAEGRRLMYLHLRKMRALGSPCSEEAWGTDLGTP